MCDKGNYGIKTWWNYEKQNVPYLKMDYKVTIMDDSELYKVRSVNFYHFIRVTVFIVIL